MAVYYSIKCPNCGKVIESGKDRQIQFGSPLRTCRYCGAAYVDNNYTEAAWADKKDLYGKSFPFSALIFVAVGGFMIYGWWVSGRIAILLIGVAMAAIGVLSVVSTIKYKPSEDAELQAEIEESKKRCSNPDYVIALWKAGGNLSPEALQWAKKGDCKTR